MPVPSYRLMSFYNPFKKESDKPYLLLLFIPLDEKFMETLPDDRYIHWAYLSSGEVFGAQLDLQWGRSSFCPEGGYMQPEHMETVNCLLRTHSCRHLYISTKEGMELQKKLTKDFLSQAVRANVEGGHLLESVEINPLEGIHDQ